MLARSRLKDLCRALARYWYSTATVWSQMLASSRLLLIYAERWRGTGIVLPQYGVKCCLEADLGIYAERWRVTRIVLPQYGVECWLGAD